MNFLPWTGPTLRASAALKIPVTDIFQPMIGVQVVGLVYVSPSLGCSASARNGGSGLRGPERCRATNSTATLRH